MYNTASGWSYRIFMCCLGSPHSVKTNSLFIKKQQPKSWLVSWRRSTLENYLVRELKKGNSEMSAWSLICVLRSVLNCQQHSQGRMGVTAYGRNTLSNPLNHTFTWFCELQWQYGYTWGNKIHKWVHRRWHMSMNRGFDIKLYCVKKVFCWQSDQAHVI